MKDMKMDKEWLGYKIWKLKQKRNILFRAFLINYVVILLAWLVSMTPFYMGLLMHFMPGINAIEANMYLMTLFGIWKIAGVVLFLIPALAIWWEQCMMQKYYDMKK
ncbi:MAG: CPP1-like family protein [Alphaproteobacteria bacterium]|nr:CPP1-like family protein [Alphaproteobacteria bacterium]